MPAAKLRIYEMNKVYRVWATLNGHTLELPNVARISLETMGRYVVGNGNFRAEIEFNNGGSTIILTDCEIEFGTGVEALDFFEKPETYAAES